jgi:hypothetical protein
MTAGTLLGIASISSLISYLMLSRNIIRLWNIKNKFSTKINIYVIINIILLLFTMANSIFSMMIGELSISTKIKKLLSVFVPYSVLLIFTKKAHIYKENVDVNIRNRLIIIVNSLSIILSIILSVYYYQVKVV